MSTRVGLLGNEKYDDLNKTNKKNQMPSVTAAGLVSQFVSFLACIM